MEKRHICQWVAEEPRDWRRLRWLLTVLAALTTAFSLYALVQRSFLAVQQDQAAHLKQVPAVAADQDQVAPGTARQLPLLLSLRIPLPAEFTAYVLWGLTLVLYFQGYAIRLFVYHALNKMCPLATPTLSERIQHAEIGSAWVQEKTRRLHSHVKDLEQERGLSFSEYSLEDFRQVLERIAQTLRRSKGIERIIVVTPLSMKSTRNPMALNLWDSFLASCGGAKRLKHCYYLIDSHSLYDQQNYEPRMERISSCLDVASRFGHVRTAYRDNPTKGSISNDEALHATVDQFLDGNHRHSLAIEKKGGTWVFLTASLGIYNTGFYGGMAIEGLNSDSTSDEANELKALTSFANAAGKMFPEWHTTSSEKAGRHVYNFEKLQSGDHAWFVDWAFTLKGWDDDFLQQIREATARAIAAGIDVRRVFVLPNGDAAARDAAHQEALRQVPKKDGPEHVARHIGFLTCPDMTKGIWSGLVQPSEASIAKARADFALYSFASDSDVLYVNNFDGAPQDKDLAAIEAARGQFEQAWDKKELFA